MLTTPPPREAQGEFNRFMADTNPLLMLLEHDLRGEKLVETEDKLTWVKAGRAKMNEDGIHSTIGYLRSLVVPNTFISNINEGDVFRICKISLEALLDDMFLNMDEYGIEANQLQDIINRCSNLVELALHRPKDAGERRYYGTTGHYVETKRFEGGGGGGILPGWFPSPFKKGG